MGELTPKTHNIHKTLTILVKKFREFREKSLTGGLRVGKVACNLAQGKKKAGQITRILHIPVKIMFNNTMFILLIGKIDSCMSVSRRIARPGKGQSCEVPILNRQINVF